MCRHVVHGDSIEELREKVLHELSDGGFADKRTELQAWCDALAVTRRLKAQANFGHERLRELGQPRGVLAATAK